MQIEGTHKSGLCKHVGDSSEGNYLKDGMEAHLAKTTDSAIPKAKFSLKSSLTPWRM